MGAIVQGSRRASRLDARAGIVMGDEIGSLVDGGYQKFFRTPSGRASLPAPDELKAIHDFEEDLKEALGFKSLYNEVAGDGLNVLPL